MYSISYCKIISLTNIILINFYRFKNSTMFKEFNSQILLSTGYINQSPNKCNNLTTQTAVIYKNNTPELKVIHIYI